MRPWKRWQWLGLLSELPGMLSYVSCFGKFCQMEGCVQLSNFSIREYDNIAHACPALYITSSPCPSSSSN